MGFLPFDAPKPRLKSFSPRAAADPMSHGTGNSMDKASANDIVKPRTGRVGCQIRMPEDMQRHAASQHAAGASKTDPDGFGAAGVGPAAGGGPNRRGRTPPPFFQGEPAGGGSGGGSGGGPHSHIHNGHAARRRDGVRRRIPYRVLVLPEGPPRRLHGVHTA